MNKFTILLLAFLVLSAPALRSEIEYDYTYVNTVTGNSPYVKTAKGMIVANNDSIWAMQPLAISNASMDRFAAMVNRYGKQLPDSVAIYVMPIPSHAAYYAPDAAFKSGITRSPHPAMIHLFESIDEGIIPVDIYGALGRHADEHIFLRTDHHWAALGAYYACQELAKEAEVPFLDLSHFTRHDRSGYVGTMHLYSGDSRVKNNPETFTYYTPDSIEYTTYYINYKLGQGGKQVIGAHPETVGPLFANQGPNATYVTFGGGDAKIIRVHTDVGNGRRALLIKDSFGNALTPFLLGSFEEVHVIDCRFFARNIKDYIAQHGITDVVFCNNISFCASKSVVDKLDRFLTQSNRF